MENERKTEPQPYIWFANSLPETVLEPLLLHLRRTLGDDAVQEAQFRPSRTLFMLSWSTSKFAIRYYQALGIVITTPADAAYSEVFKSELARFYDEVVRPIAEQIPNLTSGICEELIQDGISRPIENSRFKHRTSSPDTET